MTVWKDYVGCTEFCTTILQSISIYVDSLDWQFNDDTGRNINGTSWAYSTTATITDLIPDFIEGVHEAVIDYLIYIDEEGSFQGVIGESANLGVDSVFTESFIDSIGTNGDGYWVYREIRETDGTLGIYMQPDCWGGGATFPPGTIYLVDALLSYRVIGDSTLIPLSEVGTGRPPGYPIYGSEDLSSVCG